MNTNKIQNTNKSDDEIIGELDFLKKKDFNFDFSNGLTTERQIKSLENSLINKKSSKSPINYSLNNLSKKAKFHLFIVLNIIGMFAIGLYSIAPNQQTKQMPLVTVMKTETVKVNIKESQPALSKVSEVAPLKIDSTPTAAQINDMLANAVNAQYAASSFNGIGPQGKALNVQELTSAGKSIVDSLNQAKRGIDAASKK